MANQANDRDASLQEFSELIKGGSLRKNANERFSTDRNSRAEVDKENNKLQQPRLLHAGNIEAVLKQLDIKKASGEKYDAGDALAMTYGKKGVIRFSEAMLRAFKQNVEFLQRLYAGGITAKQVIDFSHQDDIDRANQQIHFCVPLSMQGSTVHFMTNASADSDVKNHHVHVEFLAFPSLELAPELDRNKIKSTVITYGKLKFECDCGRHRYWYRYIATIGGYNLERPEHAYPKIKNPNLEGVACKHVLRVMYFIRAMPMFSDFLLKQLDKSRSRKQGDNRRYETDTKLQEHLQQQHNQTDKQRTIKANTAKTTNDMIKLANKIDREQSSKLVQQKIKQAEKSADKPLSTAEKRQIANDAKRAVKIQGAKNSLEYLNSPLGLNMPPDTRKFLIQQANEILKRYGAK